MKNELSSISTKAEIIDSNLSVEYKFELSKIKEESSNLIIEKDKEINTYINLMEVFIENNILIKLILNNNNLLLRYSNYYKL